MKQQRPTPEEIEAKIASANGPVVVGYIDPEESGAALAFAADEAASRKVGLRIVTAYNLVVTELGPGPALMMSESLLASLTEVAERLARDAADAARSKHPGLEVTTVVDPGPAAAVILEHAADASLVVVGGPPPSRWGGLLAGGSARQVATHCSRPTIVVRDPAPTGDFVVVGIDGSSDSLGALAFAFDHASRHGLRLVTVHTWDIPPIGALTGVPAPEPPELLQSRAEAEVRSAVEELAGFSQRYPDVDVEHRVIRGPATPNLVAESAGAALLVVGSRGRGGFAGLLLGSVSHGVLHQAKCNVAVVTAKG